MKTLDQCLAYWGPLRLHFGCLVCFCSLVFFFHFCFYQLLFFVPCRRLFYGTPKIKNPRTTLVERLIKRDSHFSLENNFGLKLSPVDFWRFFFFFFFFNLFVLWIGKSTRRIASLLLSPNWRRVKNRSLAVVLEQLYHESTSSIFMSSPQLTTICLMEVKIFPEMNRDRITSCVIPSKGLGTHVLHLTDWLQDR